MHESLIQRRRGLRKLAGRKLHFSNRQLTEEIMSAQKLNFAPKSPENGDFQFQPQLCIFGRKFPTDQNLGGGGNCWGNCPCDPCHDATSLMDDRTA